MAEQGPVSPAAHAADHEAGPHAPYLKVWLFLLVFTVIEYFYAFFAKDFFLILLVGLLLWAAIKAGMVGWYFMHLKFEGAWVYILIVPAAVLATILVLALAPDVAMKPVDEEEEGEEAVWREPVTAVPIARIANQGRW